MVGHFANLLSMAPGELGERSDAVAGAHSASALLCEPETATGLWYDTVTKLGCLAPFGDSFGGKGKDADAPEGNSRDTAGADVCMPDKVVDFK